MDQEQEPGRAIILGIIILGIIAGTLMMIRLAPAWLALRHVQFW